MQSELVLSNLRDANLEVLPHILSLNHLASDQPKRHLALANFLYDKIRCKIIDFQNKGISVRIYGPEWSRQDENVRLAAEMHSKIIIETYGPDYALPNKDADVNVVSIENGDVDFYFLTHDDEFVGTACLSDNGDNRGELGRSATSRSRVGNTIIQHLRILEWLLDDQLSSKYHTLFTTARTAPDRDLEQGQSMRGGQGVTAQWKRFPELRVNGTAPLYYKHRALEQFTVAQFTRAEFQESPTFIASDADRHFVKHWHEFYGLKPPRSDASGGASVEARVHIQAPPADSSIHNLVHADITFGKYATHDLVQAVDCCFAQGSPFIQALVPIGTDSRGVQTQLSNMGFQVFGYEAASNLRPAHLYYGKVKPGHNVISTFWQEDGIEHPYWASELAKCAEQIEQRWHSSNLV